MKRRDFIKFSTVAGVNIAATQWSDIALAQDAEEPRRGGTLLMAIFPEPTTLFSGASVINQVTLFGTKINESLIALDFDFSMKPMLAREWDIAPNGLTWRFRLRDGVKWHDGRVFTSADVAFTMMEIWKKLHPRGIQSFRNITAVEAPDPGTVVFRLAAPIPFLRTELSAFDATIFPKHLYEGTDILNNPYNIKPIGTGPFKFREWVRGSHLIAERNPDYWDKPKPYLDRIVFRIIPDPAGRAAALESQQLLIAGPNPVPLIDINRLAALPHLEVGNRGSEYFSPMIYLQHNLKHPILGKVEVRRALAHAIDQNFVVRNILFGRGSPASGVVSTYQKEAYTSEVARYPFDLKKAEALLDAAGLRRGADGVRFAVTLDPNTAFEQYVRIAEYLRENFNTIGVKVTLRTEDSAAWVRRVYTNYDYDMSIFGTVLLADPTVGMQRFFYSGAISKGNPVVNSSFYSNKRVDELFDLCRTEVDTKRRARYWHEIQRIIQDDLPVIAIVNQEYTNVINKRVRGITVSPHSLFENFAGVWLSGI